MKQGAEGGRVFFVSIPMMSHVTQSSVFAAVTPFYPVFFVSKKKTFTCFSHGSTGWGFICPFTSVTPNNG